MMNVCQGNPSHVPFICLKLNLLISTVKNSRQKWIELNM